MVIKDGIEYNFLRNPFNEVMLVDMQPTNTFKGGGVKLPDKDDYGNPIETICLNNAFCVADIYDLYIPDSVAVIAGLSFTNGSPIRKLFMGKNVKRIERGCFSNISVEQVYWPDECESVDSYILANATIKKFIAGRSLRGIECKAFDKSRVEKMDLSNILYAGDNMTIWPDRWYVQEIILPYYSNVHIGGCGWKVDKESAIVRKDVNFFESNSVIVDPFDNRFVVTGGDYEWRAKVTNVIAFNGGQTVFDFDRQIVDYIVIGNNFNTGILKMAMARGIPIIRDYNLKI